MKKLILSVVLVAIAMINKSFAQENSIPSLQKVVTAYLNVKNALTADNGVNARDEAKALYKAIDQVPMEKFSIAEHKLWMEYSPKLSYDAEHMKETDDIDHQREHFTKLSLNFYKMLKAFNMNSTDLYYQYCPMANDGKGAYWVSENEMISNPYFGKKMMKCGSTKEIIKANP